MFSASDIEFHSKINTKYANGQENFVVYKNKAELTRYKKVLQRKKGFLGPMTERIFRTNICDFF